VALVLPKLWKWCNKGLGLLRAEVEAK
jgi:hypothetical protein